MAAGDSELAARVEAKAARLVKQRWEESARAEGRHERDEGERQEALNWWSNLGDAGCGLFLIPTVAAIAGLFLDMAGCVVTMCATGDTSYTGAVTMTKFLPLIGLVVAIVLFIKAVLGRGAAKRLEHTVAYDEEAAHLAQQRFASATALQERVHTLAGRMRAATDDADREAAASQLARLECELDSELA